MKAMIKLREEQHMGIPMNTHIIPMCFMGIKIAKGSFD